MHNEIETMEVLVKSVGVMGITLSLLWVYLEVVHNLTNKKK